MNCEVCEEEIYYDRFNNEWNLRIVNSNWSDFLDDFDYTEVKINFCYKCGKDYRNLKGD